ncbi:MAG: penicillin-binding protein 1A [Pseudomonadota bacterium]|nr:penicillin-binding protein 1A [Pseudomonadota bacterium]
MLRTFILFMSVISITAFAVAGGLLYLFYHYGQGLPDYTQLADYEPPVMTRVHAGDGRLLAEYARQRRVFIPVTAMPKLVRQAFLSAEDKNFFLHPGIDPVGVARAVITNLKNFASGRRLVGASTITQQVAKNFLLTSDVTFERKIKEAILAFRIERALSKRRILELYLNEIYLGLGSYGVAAAALNYFNKSLDQLDIAEAAFLAALPKAPNNYNPLKRPKAALGRRDWVIGRMLEDGVINDEQAKEERAKMISLNRRDATAFVIGDYFAEEVRRELVTRYGEDQLYDGGLSVRTTLDPSYQKIADRVLKNGLIAYDRRHGWRGPVTNILPGQSWHSALNGVEAPKGRGQWMKAIVRFVTAAAVHIGLADGSIGVIPLEELVWARSWLKGERLGPRVKRADQVLAQGDVVLVEAVHKDKKENVYPPETYGLRQIPEIEGALVALDPHTGRVLAMSGGYYFEKSQFNRAIQAQRQPGSAFKPFVYLTALDKGYTPSTLILDAPFVIDQGPGLPKWRPAKYTKKFYGPSTMRLGIEKSRNLMTVRLAQTIGIETIADMARRFGINENLPHQLSMSLGAGETTLLKLTAGYAMFVNGGKFIQPTLIDRIQDRHGNTIFKHDTRRCPKCRADAWTGQAVPKGLDTRKKVTEPESAYQIVSMLQGVVERGTGRRIKSVGKPIAGKTGTTNKALDTWFVGFTPDLALGVFAGFDQPRSLGQREQGASVAAPVFRDFMAEALKGKPAIPFRVPTGIHLVRVDSVSGRPAQPGDKKVILEAFKPGTIPTGGESVLEGVSETPVTAPATGTGGLY